MNTPETSPTLRPTCRNLRNKEMYYQAAGQEDDQFASGQCWCQKTHEAFGPDGLPAGQNECCARRSCYVG